MKVLSVDRATKVRIDGRKIFRRRGERSSAGKCPKRPAVDRRSARHKRIGVRLDDLERLIDDLVDLLAGPLPIVVFGRHTLPDLHDCAEMASPDLAFPEIFCNLVGMPSRNITDILADQLAARGESWHRYGQRIHVSPSQFSRFHERPISRALAQSLIYDPALTTEERRELIAAILEHWMDAIEVPAADRPLITVATDAVHEAGPTLELLRLQRSLKENPKLVSLLQNLLDLVE